MTPQRGRSLGPLVRTRVLRDDAAEREIPRLAGENAVLRDDAAEREI